MREHGVDGIILCPAAGTNEDLPSQINCWNLPVVQDLQHVTSQLDYAGTDYAAGMHQVLDDLTLLGHHAVALAVHGPVHFAYEERVEGFRDAMAEQGTRRPLSVSPMRWLRSPMKPDCSSIVRTASARSAASTTW
ncbi:MAG: hypothetical protein ACK4N1_10255 [Pseudorhizobium sp.]